MGRFLRRGKGEILVTVLRGKLATRVVPDSGRGPIFCTDAKNDPTSFRHGGPWFGGYEVGLSAEVGWIPERLFLLCFMTVGASRSRMQARVECFVERATRVVPDS